MTDTQQPEIVVVGAGVAGSAAAWRLSQAGHEVLLLDRFGPGHTHGASHGASRIFRHTYPDRLHIDLAREAEDGWRELESVTGTNLLTITGGIDHGDPVALDRLASGLTAAGEEFSWLSRSEAARRWPGLATRGRVLFCSGGGRLHADDSVAALQRAAVEAGASLRHHSTVQSIRRDHGRPTITLDDGEQLRPEQVVVTAGAWTPDLAGHLVPLPQVVVTEEQPAHFTVRDDLDVDAESAWPTFVHHVRPGSTRYGGTYGLLTPGEGVKVGFHGVGRVVHPDHRTYQPEPHQLAALRAYARGYLPGVDPESAVPISCTYTTTDDSVFVVDRRGPVSVGAGFSGHGFKFGPALGRLLTDLVEGRSAPAVFGFTTTRIHRSTT